VNVKVIVGIGASVAVAGGVFVLAGSSGTDSAPRSPRPDDAAVLAVGEAVYKTHCASCHGAELQGQPEWRTRGTDGRLPAPPHDASGHTWHHPDETLFRITKYGVAKAAGLKDYASAMPAYEGVLGDDDIVAVLSWIKSRWPPNVRDKHDQINAQQRAARSP
jgi:S-disulfanyl-L-cysteine oxidoreductase SoxD